jgi:hypothetical protein
MSEEVKRATVGATKSVKLKFFGLADVQVKGPAQWVVDEPLRTSESTHSRTTAAVAHGKL